MSGQSGIIDVHVGKASDDWPIEEGRARVHFHNFADLPQTKGTTLRSSKFTCAGHEWSLKLYPRGDRSAREGMISVYLCSELSSKIVVDFDINLKKKNGDDFEVNSATKTEIRPHEDYICHDANVLPKSSLADDLFTCLYQDKDTADVAFEVKARVFYAHKAILKARVPELAQLAEPYDAENSIPINDVEPDIFETMLKHAYGKDIIGASYWEDHAKQILDASGKYGFTELKSVAEIWHVKYHKQNFTVDNVIDELLYADGKNCLLLKKAAMNFIVEHGRDVIESESYGKLDESPELRKEFVKAAFSSKERKREK
eukprot:scaffold13805_cov23-Cyclotella_meneghiniana.AAC.3